MVIRKLSVFLRNCTILYLILLVTSTDARAFELPTDDAHPYGLNYDDDSALTPKDGQVKTDFLFSIPEKFYLYKESLRIETDDEAIKADLNLPAAEKHNDEFQGRSVEVYFHELSATATFTLPKDYDTSKGISGKIFYQGCSNKICYRLMNQPFKFKLAATQSTGTPAATISLSGTSSDGFFALLAVRDFAEVIKRGFFVALLASFCAGVIASFTPCVLPIIPLTLAFMGLTADTKKSAKFSSLGIFMLGMVAMYASLGVASALIGKTFGFWYQSNAFLIFLVVFFLVMGLWMLGVVPITVPATWQNAIVQFQPKGHRRHFYAGLTIGFLAAPCVGPLLGPILVYISITQSIVTGFLLMTSYALGLGILFFVLGFFSREWVRRAGEKSNMVKKTMGALLILPAFFYGYVLAKPYLPQASSEGFFIKSYDEALKTAQSEHKGVMIDFYADWCVPCHEWDKGVWSNSAAQAKITKHFVPLKIDCTRDTKECKAAVDHYNVIGWPTVVFLDHNAQEMPDKRLVGQVMDAGEFEKYLDEVVP